MRSWNRSVLMFAALGVALSPGTAHAERCDERALVGFSTCVDVDELWSHPGSTLFLSFAPTETTPAGQFAASMSASYVRRPFRLEASGPSLTPREVDVIDNLVDATFNFSLGVTDRLAIDLSAPVTFYQDGAGYYALTGSDEVLPRSVIRDPRIGLALAILPRERVADAQGLALVGRFDFSAPLGDEDSFAGAPTVVFAPGFDASYRVGPVEVQAELAARVRGTEDLGATRYGSQLFTGLGANVLVWAPAQLSLSAEIFALPVLASQGDGVAPLVPGEWLASARVAPFLSGDVFFQAGAGTAVPFTESAVSAPQVRASLAFGYAPRATDSDRDGVLDRDDACPAKPEDRDGFQDSDGCPEPDNDGDRIPDTKDRCRDAAETIDGFKDDDGCPDLDDDSDGVPDVDDACRNEPEDKDGFEDDDGCPELDNDNDGVSDGTDRCKDKAEDRDGFQDEDGCPDLDNDSDGVLDDTDRCKNAREDLDKFQDEDGCPDPDNDGDGLLDGADRCPTEAETLDGKADDDGCPEAGATTLAKVESSGRVTFTSSPRFAAGKADVSAAMNNQLAVAASILQSQPVGTVLVIEVFPDRAGDSALAQRRATSVRKAFAALKLGDRVTIATGDLGEGHDKDAPHIDVTLVRSSE